MNFMYTAMNASGEQISEVLDCADESEARTRLTELGLFVTKLEPGRKRDLRRYEPRALATGSAAPARRSLVPAWMHNHDHEQMIFARQMAMMLHAGAPMVSAMRAIIEQTVRPEWRHVLSRLADEVEGGETLSSAMARQPKHFSGMVRNIVSAGEATAGLSESFERLSEMLVSSQRTRKTIVAALVYPALLCLMSIGVMITLTVFVLPRFADLFKLLDTELPFITRQMLDGSEFVKHNWLAVVCIPSSLIAAAIWWLRTERGRNAIDRVVLRMPGIGPAVSGVILAKLLRTWGALLRSNVPLLDAIRQTRTISRHLAFARLNSDVIDAVTEGRELHGVLKASPLVPASVVAAIATGEQTGKLGESLEFVAAWLEEQNDSRIGTLTRLFEPMILVILGVMVGGVCISLFLPLFDVATAA